MSKRSDDWQNAAFSAIRSESGTEGAPKKVRKPRRKKSPFAIVGIVLLSLVLLVGGIAGGGLIWFRSRMGAELDQSDTNRSMGEVLASEFGITDEGSQAAVTDFSEWVQEQPEEVQSAISEADKALEDVQRDAEPVPVSADIKNYLLIGSDRRSTGEYGRSDTMMILSINNSTGKIHLTSLMRAIYVTIPRSSGNTNGMLNWAYAMGGPELAVKTVEYNFKVTIDGYVIVDFSSFEKVLDAIGTVQIELGQTEASVLSNRTGRSYFAGLNELDSFAALTYARDRHDSDFSRTQRQRNVVTAALKKARSLGIGELTSLVNTVLGYVDTDLSTGEISNLLLHSGTILSYPIDGHMIPIENEDGAHFIGITFINGAEMYAIDWPTNLQLIKDFINE